VLVMMLLSGACGTVLDSNTKSPLVSNARLSMDQLMIWYDNSTGLWKNVGWWNSANAMEAVIEYIIRSGDSTYLYSLQNTFDKQKSGNFLNDYYDDEGWWGLTWVKAYDLTKNTNYLNMAKTIHADMSNGWDNTCKGGVWWNKEKTYKNAIPNELFLSLSTALSRRLNNDQNYLNWAVKEWNWFAQSGMINSNNLINDGLTSSCVNNGGTTWTYNQGVILSGLMDLWAMAQNNTKDQAYNIAEATLKYLTKNGILTEPCEPNCGGDGPQFKGIFVRNLAYYVQLSYDDSFQSFIANNAASIWSKDRNSGNQLGLMWAGPYDSADATRQSSAQDCLNSAL